MRFTSIQMDDNNVLHGQFVDKGGLLRSFTANQARNIRWTGEEEKLPTLYRQDGTEIPWATTETDAAGKVTLGIPTTPPTGIYWLVPKHYLQADCSAIRINVNWELGEIHYSDPLPLPPKLERKIKHT
ncbi:MAG TPA: hypothetical protein VMR75_01260 [Candidatus Saccharimonadales bacterium]|nr:hypothetical protein [Candidatus Saccharimonadales bacterium]